MALDLLRVCANKSASIPPLTRKSASTCDNRPIGVQEPTARRLVPRSADVARRVLASRQISSAVSTVLRVKEFSRISRKQAKLMSVPERVPDIFPIDLCFAHEEIHPVDLIEDGKGV